MSGIKGINKGKGIPISVSLNPELTENIVTRAKDCYNHYREVKVNVCFHYFMNEIHGIFMCG